MTLRSRWDETRSLIEAGWNVVQQAEPADHPDYSVVKTALLDGLYAALGATDWEDTKQAQHDGSRQIYGDAGKFMRGGEPG